MRRALPFLAAAAVALLVPATARAAPPTCHEFLLQNPDTPITVPGQAVSLASPCGAGAYTLNVDAAPGNGTVTVSGTTLTYAPDDGFHGLDTFSYTATDGADTSPPARVEVIVDNRPSCTDASATVGTGRSLALSVTACSDLDGDALTV